MAFRGAPDILFSRMGFDDSHTVDRYVRTGGYEALPEALKRTPEELVGRGQGSRASAAAAAPASRPA